MYKKGLCYIHQINSKKKKCCNIVCWIFQIIFFYFFFISFLYLSKNVTVEKFWYANNIYNYSTYINIRLRTFNFFIHVELLVLKNICSKLFCIIFTVWSEKNKFHFYTWNFINWPPFCFLLTVRDKIFFIKCITKFRTQSVSCFFPSDA